MQPPKLQESGRLRSSHTGEHFGYKCTPMATAKPAPHTHTLAPERPKEQTTKSTRVVPGCSDWTVITSKTKEKMVNFGRNRDHFQKLFNNHSRNPSWIEDKQSPVLS